MEFKHSVDSLSLQLMYLFILRRRGRSLYSPIPADLNYTGDLVCAPEDGNNFPKLLSIRPITSIRNSGG